ncbi:MAG: L-serine ammonia-lyase, iron-sulfur-dependent, subunit alpha [Acholeplasmatales bacterium]|nr:L-serine ammonia-lyase, iron-sulfur-dependent, subunit alpha [Acholeplasmatales bacterium]
MIIIKTCKDLYKIGNGPSSSHTMGPKAASLEFRKRYPNLASVKVTLYGSLALTGRGHLTDYIVKSVFDDIECEIIFDLKTEQEHPNTMLFVGLDNDGNEHQMIAVSVGGGDVEYDNVHFTGSEVYPHNSFDSIKDYCVVNNITLAEYVDKFEDINDYLNEVYSTMLNAISRGLKTEGLLPGELGIKRKAKSLMPSKRHFFDKARRKTIAYAYAASEENACGGIIVTAPTCGASGVLPAVLKTSIDTRRYKRKTLIDGLKVAGLIGNLIRTNASISGAVAGCQAEVGSACSMAAAFLAYINNSDIDVIQRAAEIALEHHLGLTCDPVKGYVQIPCIERNAVAALRAQDAYLIASELISGDAKISFDMICKTMLKTGKDLSSRYRETSEGGLALDYGKDI